MTTKSTKPTHNLTLVTDKYKKENAEHDTEVLDTVGSGWSNKKAIRFVAKKNFVVMKGDTIIVFTNEEK